LAEIYSDFSYINYKCKKGERCRRPVKTREIPPLPGNKKAPHFCEAFIKFDYV